MGEIEIFLLEFERRILSAVVQGDLLTAREITGDIFDVPNRVAER
jgi:hypothetical protein